MIRFLLRAGAAPLALVSGTALAQSATSDSPADTSSTPEASVDVDGGIVDIVVTAQKREEKLQDVPIAITAVGAVSLERQNVKSVIDLSKLSVPGLVTSELVGSPIFSINMRGISTADVEQATVEQGVALYVDGVYISRSQGLSGDIVDVERVEVLRGPQGTLFGRNAEGGAISIVSKKPTGEFGGRIGGEIGDFGNRRGYIHLNLPEVANFAIKLDGYKEVFDGYTVNRALAPGQVLDQHVDFGRKNNIGGRAQVLWTPSPVFSALFTYDRSRLRNSPTYAPSFIPTVGNPNPDPNYLPITNLALYNEFYKDKVSGLSLVLTYDVADDIQIKSITARRKLVNSGSHNIVFNTAFPIDLAGNQLSGVLATRATDSKTFSQELQLVGTSGDVQYTVGAFYFNERTSAVYDNFATIFIPVGGAPFSVNPIPLTGPSDQAIESNAFAIYGQATWAPSSLDEKLKLTLGGRYTDDRKSGTRTVNGGVTLVPPLRPADTRASRFDPAFTAAYEVTDDINVYARYAQAFRSGGFTIPSPTFRKYDAETNKQVEIGFKGDFLDRRVRLNVAAFHSWVKDQQINQVPADCTTCQEILNADGTTRIRGIEFEATVIPFQGLVLSGSLAFQGGKQPPYDCGGCIERRFPYLPKTAGGFNGDYTLPLADDTDLIFHLDYQYKSKYSTSPTTYLGNVHPFSTANVWNGRVGIDSFNLGGARVKVAGYVENIFDNHEIVFDTNSDFQTRRNPRRFGVNLEVGF